MRPPTRGRPGWRGSTATILPRHFGFDHVPVGLEFIGVDQVLVVEEIRHIDAADENKNMTALRIHILVLAFPPFRSRPITSGSSSAGLIGSRAFAGYEHA